MVSHAELILRVITGSMSKGLQVKRSTGQKVPKSKGPQVKRATSQKVPSQKVYKNLMLEIKAY